MSRVLAFVRAKAERFLFAIGAHTIPELTMRHLPKIMLHEHLDCSLRPRTMLELMEVNGFPADFPEDIKSLWLSGSDATSPFDAELARSKKDEAVGLYQKYLVTFASSSLANYVQAIVDHILPLMQSEENLYRITKERVEDAVNDGIIGMELRFAPQLHTMKGLSLDQVMSAVISAIEDAPIPVALIVCALRHENDKVGRQLADLVLRYRENIGAFDLAADEAARPGVLRWFVQCYLVIMAKTRLLSGSPSGWDDVVDVMRTVHLWETNEPTDDDILMLEVLEGKHPELLRDVLKEALSLARIKLSADDFERLFGSIKAALTKMPSRIGHGFRGDRQGDRVLEICPTSNVVTGQVVDIASHPIDKLLRAGHRVTLNTDGTLFTEVQLTDECIRMNRTFGWTRDTFHRVFVHALEAASFSPGAKAELRAELDRGYRV